MDVNATPFRKLKRRPVTATWFVPMFILQDWSRGLSRDPFKPQERGMYARREEPYRRG
jgi:hypothetical protein